MSKEQSPGVSGQPSEGVPDAAAVQQWLVTYIADLLEFEPSEVNPKLPLGRYGLDSTAAVALTGDLGQWLGCEINPKLLYEYKTIEALAEFVTANRAKLRKPEK
ncbi:acyl carrier protein [Hyalangium versicolor]|uniref:acyl carrier protein n=1 Tax=Hyalangium versicolor TaxID=2861190 RepID=UPI001CCE905C|nr:acyl carrier protein [Hyalangium versicolor]